MALIQTPMQSTDAKMFNTAQGVSFFMSGPSFVQYKPSVDLTSTTTETPLFTTVDADIVNFGPNNPSDKSSLGFPANSLTLGSIWQVELNAALSTTGTPNLIFKAYLNNPATPLALTGTSILGSSGAGSNATNFIAVTGPTNATIILRFVVTAVGTAGVIASTAKVIYSAGVNATDTTISTFRYVNTVDTTLPYVLNVTGKWSASSASNIFSLKNAVVSLVG